MLLNHQVFHSTLISLIMRGRATTNLNQIFSLKSSSKSSQIEGIDSQNETQLISILINGNLSLNILSSMFFMGKGNKGNNNIRF